MGIFLLALVGVAIGCGLVLLPFPTNGVILFALVLLILTFLYPFAVILFLLGITPFRILWLEGGIAPLEFLYSMTFLWLLGFSFLRILLRHGETPYRSGERSIVLPLVFMALVGIWGACIAIFRGHPFAHWASDLNFILFFWLYFAVSVSFTECRDIYRVLWPALWITAGVVVWGVIERLMESALFTGFTPGFPRGMAFSSSFFILSLCLFLFSEKGSLKRRGLFWASSFFGLHQFLSFVRVAWISQIGTAGFLLMVLPASEKRRFLRWTGVVFVVVSLLFSLSWMLPMENRFVKMPVYLMDRFMSIFTDTTGTGATMRTRYSEWEAALKQYLQHPFLGNGLGTQIQYVRYDYASLPLDTERYIHSSYIYYLLNTGPAGLLLFLWFCLCSVRYGLGVYQKLPVSELKGLALGMTACLVFQIFSSIAGNELSNPSRTIWTGFFLGSLAVIEREIRRKASS